jgi:DnaJ-class molecular chaperone
MAFIDYYKVLGVDKRQRKLRLKAFRKMARKYHPDLNQTIRKLKENSGTK